MKKISLIALIFFINLGNAQGLKEFKKLKCLKNKMASLENVLALDTVFILYYKSDKNGFEQGRYDAKYYLENRYVLGKTMFSYQIYDFEGEKKVNFRDPNIMDKSKNYICKNRERIIDVNFFINNWYILYNHFNEVKPILYVIDLDQKVKHKYKIVQVNHPSYVIE